MKRRQYIWGEYNYNKEKQSNIDNKNKQEEYCHNEEKCPRQGEEKWFIQVKKQVKNILTISIKSV